MSPLLTEIRPRHLRSTIEHRLATEPVLVLSGPRTAGKSTLLGQLAAQSGQPIIDLDDLVTRQVAVNDPGLIVSGESPVLIDEFQHVPEILSAIKAELNRDLRAGRYVLTGSTRYATLPRAAQSLTGRVHLIDVLPLSQGEICGHRETFLDAILDEPRQLVTSGVSATSREEYAERVLGGGFPLALSRATPAERGRWFRDYINVIVTRDVLEISKIRQRSALPRLLRRLASQTGQVLKIAEAARDSGLEQSTADRYITLLESVFMIHRLPAWGNTLASRVGHLPKVHLIDSGLAGWLMGITPEKLAAKNPAALTEFGHLVETFAVGEILKQLSWSDHSVEVGHFRSHDDQEVDLILETWDGRVAAVEVKAGSRVTGPSLKAMTTLRDRLGDRFIGGVALYLGARAYTFDERIHVVPLDHVWR
ncbi:ATP-binding protein [Streptosporangium sp. KLBMP 9127]|nr:ATP-binding protein [Streptosporangium sp. KLBMP 9127]